MWDSSFVSSKPHKLKLHEVKSTDICDGNRLGFYYRSLEIIRLTQPIDHQLQSENLLINNSATMFVVDNMKTRQRGEDPGNQLEFHFDLRKLFISVLLSSTLVTFLITVSRSKNYFYGQLLIKNKF